jgi:hypothetical protein
MDFVWALIIGIVIGSSVTGLVFVAMDFPAPKREKERPIVAAWDQTRMVNRWKKGEINAANDPLITG